MPSLVVTPILLHYNYLEKLASKAAALLALDITDISKYQQFKISIFLNFNRYLVDCLLFLPVAEAEKLFQLLTPAMEAANEEETLRILETQIDFFSEIRSDFLDIIKNIKK